MNAQITLPETIPVFPLPGALLLPRSILPLHLFEPRYLQMLDDALATPHRMIGMVQPIDTGADRVRLHQIGCAGRVTRFSETDDGRYMIQLSGISRYRVKAPVASDKPYLSMDVSWHGFERDRGGAETDPGFDRPAFFDLLSRFFTERGLSTEWDNLDEADDERLINALSMLCPFDPEEKQALLEAPDLTTRRETLVALMEFTLHGRGEDERMQ